MEQMPEGETVCTVCFKNVVIYSIGPCDHPVCYECSTRMRVLCSQKECPICRTDMPQVVFTTVIRPFVDFFLEGQLDNVHYGIVFMSERCEIAFYKLLELRCKLCDKIKKREFRQMHQLKDHMRRIHGLFYCEICLEHVKIFSSERNCYTRQKLEEHNRKGDTDNRSHRGHPLCEFCNTRYLDSDELFRHLRRDHYYCHLCDTEGKHQFYRSLEDVQQHFRHDHFLCEEGECKSVPMAAVFPNEIDFKAHVAALHRGALSKHASKQARTLDLQFAAPSRTNRRNNDTFVNVNNDSTSLASTSFSTPLTSGDFPALGNNTATDPMMTYNLAAPSVSFVLAKTSKFSGADFPALAPVVPSTSGGKVSTVAPSSVKVRNQIKVKSSNIRHNSESFPALSGTGGSASAQPTVWGKKSTVEGATRKQLPIRQKTTNNLDDLNQFPQLNQKGGTTSNNSNSIASDKKKKSTNNNNNNNNSALIHRNKSKNNNNEGITTRISHLNIDPQITNCSNNNNNNEDSDQVVPAILYYEAVDFSERNRNLVRKIASVINPDQIRMLKNYSDLYRSGGLVPILYYEYCRNTLDGVAFEQYFPDLLVLLPDIKKQQELYKLYNGNRKKQLTTCPQCKQVIFTREQQHHLQLHID